MGEIQFEGPEGVEEYSEDEDSILSIFHNEETGYWEIMQYEDTEAKIPDNVIKIPDNRVYKVKQDKSASMHGDAK